MWAGNNPNVLKIEFHGDARPKLTLLTHGIGQGRAFRRHSDKAANDLLALSDQNGRAVGAGTRIVSMAPHRGGKAGARNDEATAGFGPPLMPSRPGELHSEPLEHML